MQVGFYCERHGGCRAKGWKLNSDGLAFGGIPGSGDYWTHWHKKECGGVVSGLFTADERAAMIETIDKLSREVSRMYRGEIDRPGMTCCACPENTRCEYAWDLYNLDGDCLMHK